LRRGTGPAPRRVSKEDGAAVSDVDHRLCGVEEVPSAGSLRVAIPDREPAAVFKVSEGFVTVDDGCTHNGASLAKKARS
jgi:nitrite reductase/ring-hydroxylating ferredoxin subunit